jgi:hypothetical protein
LSSRRERSRSAFACTSFALSANSFAVRRCRTLVMATATMAVEPRKYRFEMTFDGSKGPPNTAFRTT